LARRSFAEFVKATIPYMQISTEITWGWYLDAICEHLQAWVEGRIRKLLINVKNKSLKSKVAEVALPAWQWAQDPTKHWFTGAGSQELATKFSWQGRELIESDWYQGYLAFLEDQHKHLSPKQQKPRWELMGDQNVKRFYANTRGGARFAAWPPMGTGHEGDFFLVDDPVGIEESYSNAANERANRWVTQTLMSRFNDIKTARLCVLQHRLRKDDTSGKLREMFEASGELCVLSLPLEYDPRKYLGPTLIGWEDPRAQEGESLCPERWGAQEIEHEQLTQGPKYQAVCNQDPQQDGLAVVQREWFKTWGHDAPLPPRSSMQIIQTWDLSFKGLDPTAPRKRGEEEKRSKTGGLVIGFTENPARAWILDREHEFMDWGQQKEALRRVRQRWPDTSITYIEDKANGTAIVHELSAGIPGVHPGIPGIVPVDPGRKGGKYLRFASVAGYAQAGNVYVPPSEQCPWVEEFLDNLCDFPSAPFDEDVDCFSQALSEKWQPRKMGEQEQADQERAAQLLKIQELYG
jgi:predicted phage terminase large subunit-like protein